MFAVIDLTLDNGHVFRVVRPFGSSAEQPETVVPELIGLLTDGKFLLLETRDTNGGMRHAMLSARHIATASWQIYERVPTRDDQTMWHLTGAPPD